MKTVEDLQQDLHNKCNIYRSLHRLVNLDTFHEAFKRANDAQKQKVFDHIQKCDKDSILKWIKHQLTDEFTLKSLKDLREMGSKLAIRNYQKLSKMELLSAIEQKLKVMETSNET